jgi:uncharacterized membrane protein YdfJ with MMPL/SSD domain
VAITYVDEAVLSGRSFVQKREIDEDAFAGPPDHLVWFRLDRTGDNGLAVADGLAATARVITAAAAIMITVFASFILGDNNTVKVFGFGLAIAILLDATIVRMLLVPATMEVLGKANWWLPRWLDRVTPHLNVEVTSDLESELTVIAPATAQSTSPTS